MKNQRRDDQRSRTVLVLLVLAALTVISLDAGTGSDSIARPARSAVGSVLGPAESGATQMMSPVRTVGDFFRSRDGIKAENAKLRRENELLRSQVNSSEADRNRLAEYDDITKTVKSSGFKSVNARVVGIGAAQSFSRTVTINAGTDDGIRRDMTVLNGDGLVGRVLRATRSNATVLLIVDRASTVGGRLGSDNELGFLRGDGKLSGSGRLTLSAVDGTTVPKNGDAVVSWGSRNAVPYVAGVPIGRVEKVTATPRQQSYTVTVAPYVDFSSLDVVAVVVGKAKGGNTKGGKAKGGNTKGGNTKGSKGK